MKSVPVRKGRAAIDAIAEVKETVGRLGSRSYLAVVNVPFLAFPNV